MSNAFLKMINIIYGTLAAFLFGLVTIIVLKEFGYDIEVVPEFLMLGTFCGTMVEVIRNGMDNE